MVEARVGGRSDGGVGKFSAARAKSNGGAITKQELGRVYGLPRIYSVFPTLA